MRSEAIVRAVRAAEERMKQVRLAAAADGSSIAADQAQAAWGALHVLGDALEAEAASDRRDAAGQGTSGWGERG